MNPDHHILPGLPRETAPQRYADLVNGPDTLVSDLPVLPGRLEQLRELMHDPITADEARALNDVLYCRRRWKDMIEWLKDAPVSWDGYFAREIFRAEEADRVLQERLDAKDAEQKARESTDAWKALYDECADLREKSKARSVAEHLPFAVPCSRCGTPPEHLEWFRYPDYPSCFSGWKTRCRFCLQEDDANEFIEIMGGPRRRDVSLPAAIERAKPLKPRR